MKIVELEETGGTPEIFFDFIAKHFGHRQLLSMAWNRLAILCMQLMPFKWLSLKTRKVFPLGYIMVAEKH